MTYAHRRGAFELGGIRDQDHVPGIRDDRLPAGSVLLFREPSVWDRYKWLIVGSAFMRLLEKPGPVVEMQAKLAALAKTLRAALDEG